MAAPPLVRAPLVVTPAELFWLTVGLWIGGAYWFTSSTSFANPAITVARGLSDSFAGIAPQDVPPFIVAQLLGAGLAALVTRALFDPDPEPVRPSRLRAVEDHVRAEVHQQGTGGDRGFVERVDGCATRRPWRNLSLAATTS